MQDFGQPFNHITGGAILFIELELAHMHTYLTLQLLSHFLKRSMIQSWLAQFLYLDKNLL